MSDRSDQALIEFVCQLVQCRSVLGQEREVAQQVVAKMEELGFDEAWIDPTGNAIGVIEGGRPGKTLVFDAHMDTVDVLPATAWSRDPFSGTVEGGRIFGRGSSDMKGALAAMVFGLAETDRGAIAGKLVVSASVGEESIEGLALASVLEQVPADFVVIGEASELRLVRAGRGRAEYVLEAVGLPSHASSPQLGRNAVLEMMGWVGRLEALDMPRDLFVGQGVMCLTDIISEPYPAHSVVPSRCLATYERRLLPGETQEQVGQELESAAAGRVTEYRLALAQARFETYTGARLETPKWFPAWQISEDHEVVRRAVDGLARAGLEVGFAAYQFCTNAAYTAGVAGVPTIGFGPSRESLAHIIDEYLEIEQLLAARKGYLGIAIGLLGS